MATQLLFYEAAVPVSATRHGDWSIEPRDYSFSGKVNAVPLTTVEFLAAAAEYAIVFAGQPGALMPAAILGVRAAQNLFLKQEGGWDAKYIPAFVRRYPFVFSRPAEGQAFTLCLDESFPGFNQAGRGQRLFSAEQKPTPYTENVLEFLRQYQREFERTQAFGRKLEELGLLAPMQAQIAVPAGERLGLAGFMAADRRKLAALSPLQLAQLAGSDELEWIYLHLLSMRNFGLMRDRLGEAPAPIPAAAAPEPAAVPDLSIRTVPASEDAPKPRKRRANKLSS